MTTLELLPLAVAAGILGVGIAWISLDELARIAGAELPRADGIAIEAGSRLRAQAKSRSPYSTVLLGP